MNPKLDEWYTARDLPSGSVVGTSTGTQYVIGRSRCCMRWEQPIPGSETWRVRYEGRLPQGVWMTPRERAEVDEVHHVRHYRVICSCSGDRHAGRSFYEGPDLSEAEREIRSLSHVEGHDLRIEYADIPPIQWYRQP